MKTRFRADKAAHAVEFFKRLLVHTKGEWARQPFILEPFQIEIIEGLFGWQMLDPDSGDWVRLYNLAWLEIARKNGKSELMAGIGLYLLAADDEEGAEIYSVAADKDQASLVFDVAKRMLEMRGIGGPPRSGKPFTLYPTHKRIVYGATGSFYRVLAADALGNLGQNPHGILFDEVLAQPNGQLWDAMKTGFGARRQPMLVAATTAGDNPASFAQIEHDFSLRVTEDQSLAPRRFVRIYRVPETDNWRDPANWPKANPALGLFLKPQVLRDELAEALNNPRAERAFRQYRLNQWQVSAVEGWDGAESWHRGSAGMVVETKQKGKPAWVGMVAASATDMTSICVLTKNPEGVGWWASWRWFAPEDSLMALDRDTNGLASTWVAQKRLELTDGNVIDVEHHAAVMREIVKRYDVREVAYDPNGAIGIVSPLVDDLGDRLIQIYPTNPGSALLDWERLLKSDPVEFVHAGDPIATWQLGGLRVKDASTGVLKIDRKHSETNVSGIAACELALRRALLDVDRKTPEMAVTYR